MNRRSFLAPFQRNSGAGHATHPSAHCVAVSLSLPAHSHAYPCGTLKPPLSEAQATKIMAVDVAKHYAPCVQKKVKRKLTPNQFSSVVSFVYNLGCGGSSITALTHAHVRSQANEQANR